MNSNQYTIEIESRDGEPFDPWELSDMMDDRGLKMKTAAPGSHLLAQSAVRAAKDRCEMAARMLGVCLGETEDEEVD